MNTKEKLLALLEENKGVYFSGEEIAQRLCVSRAAICKAVKSLREEGYEIHAVTNKGYCLSAKNDVLSKQGVRRYLQGECENLDIHVFPVIDSTNTLVREKAAQGQPEGYVAIANEQTEGRGRRGRSFFSPSGTGLYLSILLRPDHYSPEQATRFTTMAAVAMCEAIEEISDECAQIKWVNDIFVRGRKVCGILTEAALDLESRLLDYAVLGTGINVYVPKEGFPKEIAGSAGAVLTEEKDDVKNRLAGAFLNHFMKYYRSREQSSYIEAYQKRSLAIGREVTVISPNCSTRTAFAYGVDEECRLLVRYEDGKTEALSSGEISIRL